MNEQIQAAIQHAPIQELPHVCQQSTRKQLGAIAAGSGFSPAAQIRSDIEDTYKATMSAIAIMKGLTPERRAVMEFAARNNYESRLDMLQALGNG